MCCHHDPYHPIRPTGFSPLLSLRRRHLRMEPRAQPGRTNPRISEEVREINKIGFHNFSPANYEGREFDSQTRLAVGWAAWLGPSSEGGFMRGVSGFLDRSSISFAVFGRRKRWLWSFLQPSVWNPEMVILPAKKSSPEMSKQISWHVRPAK